MKIEGLVALPGLSCFGIKLTEMTPGRGAGLEEQKRARSSSSKRGSWLA